MAGSGCLVVTGTDRSSRNKHDNVMNIPKGFTNQRSRWRSRVTREGGGKEEGGRRGGGGGGEGRGRRGNKKTKRNVGGRKW